MQIVIEIPRKTYEHIRANGGHGVFNAGIYEEEYIVTKSIFDGTPLPEHHGRLIDADEMLDDIIKKNPASVSETEKCKEYARLVYYWAVKNAPTIIEGSEIE